MKVGLFNPYFATMGGGERYFLTTAEFFLRRGDTVDIFWSGDTDIQKIKTRFNLDLTGVNFVKDIFSGGGIGTMEKLMITAGYGLIFFLSDGSIPLSFARRNILHFQVPFNHVGHKGLLNRLKLARFQEVVCNSVFTKNYIDRTYGVASKVIYPPVDTEAFLHGKKENIILSVGRFFGPSHPKKQEMLLEIFKTLCMQGLRGWKLILVGGVTEGADREVERLKGKMGRFPVKIVTDSSFAILRDYYARAKIYWHATGFGEDLEKYPERAEHFGITTVEAMAAGAVPIVFAGGGQKEIVEEGESGFFWQTAEELIKQTGEVINTPKLREKISAAVQKRAKLFSKKRFFSELEQLLNML